MIEAAPFVESVESISAMETASNFGQAVRSTTKSDVSAITSPQYGEHYNNVRLNSAIGYITPKDMLAGHQQEIQADRKLEAAREQRKNRRQGAA
jgi:hypothetical protein